MILDTNALSALAGKDSALLEVISSASSLALQHQMPVLSRDRHFDHVPGIERVSW